MPATSSQMLAAVVRLAIGLYAGGLVKEAQLTPDQVQSASDYIAAALLATAALGWSLWHKYRLNQWVRNWFDRA